MSKFFTIITVSYNQAEYLEECILSIASQSEDVEHIIIDGGSTDHSVEVIKKYERNIAYWISERDNGPANALNKGLEKATGEFIGYINSDDFLLSGALKVVRQTIEQHPGFDVYYGAGIIVDAKGNKIQTVRPTKWNIGVYRTGLSVMFQQSEFIRRVTLGSLRFNEKNTTHWDGELLVDLTLRGALFCRFNEVVSAFRIHSQSISGGVQGTSGLARYKDQVERVKRKIDEAKPGLIKSRIYWLLWLSTRDTRLMGSRLLKWIFALRKS